MSFESQNSKASQVPLGYKFLVIHSFQTNGFRAGPNIDGIACPWALLGTSCQSRFVHKPSSPGRGQPVGKALV